MFQTTIQREVSTEGVGLHTGVFGHLRLLPAPADTGIVFRRTDLDDFRIEASGRNVARVSYATSLMKQGVLLSTTEHLLAAIYSFGLDNVFIDIDAIEVPSWTARPNRSCGCWTPLEFASFAGAAAI